MTTIILLSLLLVIAIVAVALLFIRMRKLVSAHVELSQEHDGLKERLKGITDIDAEKEHLRAEIEATKQRAAQEIEADRQQALSNLEEERSRLQSNISSLQLKQQEAAQQLEEQIRGGQAELEAIKARAREAEAQAYQTFQQKQGRLAAELESLQLNINRLQEELKPLDEEAYLLSFGFYKPRYDFANSGQYQTALDRIREKQKQMIKDKSAAVCYIEWSVSGSRAEGRKATNQTLRLILRAFNGESDAAIAKVKYNNIHVMEARIRKAWEAINSLTSVQQCEIAYPYLELKLQELYLAHEYQEKIQEEKEEQRRIREQMREEEIALRELERARIEAEKEETRYAEALRKAREEAERAVGDKQLKLTAKVEELQRRLEEAQTNKQRAVARAQMTRSGHVYIISNLGSFGEDVYKIGMTRRLDPTDRVRELGDASVPFLFDVHAIIYSEDAPALENALHLKFHHRRVNRVNERKEFFRVTIDEIAEVVRQHHGEIEIIKTAEAADYRKTLAMMQELQAQAVAPTVEIKPTTQVAGAGA